MPEIKIIGASMDPMLRILIITTMGKDEWNKKDYEIHTFLVEDTIIWKNLNEYPNSQQFSGILNYNTFIHEGIMIGKRTINNTTFIGYFILDPD